MGEPDLEMIKEFGSGEDTETNEGSDSGSDGSIEVEAFDRGGNSMEG